VLLNQESNNNQAQTTIPALSLSVAEMIATNPYVKNYYVSDAANVNSTTIKPAQTQSSSNDFQRNFSSFSLSGTNRTENLDIFLGNVKLVSGRTLTADDLKSGNKVVIISEDVVKSNNLQIGDTISLSRVTQQRPNNQNSQPSVPGATTTVKSDGFQIVGIYQAVKEGFDVNTLFTSNTVIETINGTTASDNTNASIVFLLDSPDHVNAFKQEASSYLTSKYHVLYSDDSEYVSLTKPLNLISFITSILIWVVFIAGAAIIIALVTIFVRDRKFEIGLLLSSGEGRLKIVSQFIIEMLIISILAFVISTVSSSITSKGVSTWIVDNQLLSQTSLISTSTASTESRQFQNMGGPFGQNNISLYGAVDMQSVADEFDVSINSSVIGELLLASIVLVLLGSSVPLFIIMRYKPRQIMQDDN
jgi:putative ABC transport system permease protein